MEPNDSDDEELNKLIAEIDNPSEESKIPKKEEKTQYVNKHKPEWADKKDDEHNTYEYSEDIELSDNDW